METQTHHPPDPTTVLYKSRDFNEILQIAQQDVQDDPRNIYTSQAFGLRARVLVPTAPDTNKTRKDVSTMEKPINKECTTAMETKQTTPGKTSTRFRNPVTAWTITRSLDRESD